MPLTNAEKQRRYRENLKNNPEKKEEIRKKNLDRIKKLTKKVSDMTEDEKKVKREIWRQQKKKQKEKKNDKSETLKAHKKRTKSQFNIIKKVRIMYKRSLEAVENLKKTSETLRKRNYRLKTRLEAKIKEKNKEIDMLKCRNEVLETMIKKIYATSDSNKKRRIRNVVTLQAQNHNIESKRYVADCLGIVKIHKYKKIGVLTRSKRISKKIQDFFVRDDVSRITAGKRECRTKNKQKQQIRYLTDTLRNLYEIYKAEGGQQSFSTFHKYKPFFVLSPTLNSRNTCLCIKHSNIDYLLKALVYKNLIERGTTLKDTVSRITCDITCFDCMHGKCPNCINSTIEFNINDQNQNEEAKWWWWETEKHTYKKKEKTSGEDQEIQTRKMTKKVKTETLVELVTTFNRELKIFKKHYFNMKTQQNQYQKCLKQLNSHEVLILCDFSENYNCKLVEEVQSMHFGASKQQVTLHCVMVYWNNKCQSICTVSESPCHEPAAIWAHLLPVIRFIRENTPKTKVLHFFSDGPTSQYRQKKNYYLLNLFAHKMSLDFATWSYSESGHGKGVADGIGGAVKRSLDRQVLYGHDIRNAEDVFTNICAAMKSVKSFLIPIQEIENMKKVIPTNLRPISGNNDIHQIITSREENVVHYRPLSCFCGSEPGLCSCYLPKRHLLRLPEGRLTDCCVDKVTVSEQKHSASPSQMKTPISSKITLNESLIHEEVEDIELFDSVDMEVIEVYGENSPNVLSLDLMDFNAMLLNTATELNTSGPSETEPVNCLRKNEITVLSATELNSPGPSETEPVNCLTKNELTVLSATELNSPRPSENEPVDYLPRIKIKRECKKDEPLPKKQKTSDKNLQNQHTKFLTCNKCSYSILGPKAKCMSCKNIYCVDCIGGPVAFDYLCDTCLDPDDKD